ncbi:glycosyltransferase [Cyanobium sp. Morenito 9A2]|uniref:glycosyltransferase n=1 Tax=Cyanobium sp. Morenito 9A2 TaxID=2823718 RepID=UPI0037C085E9
MDLFGDHTIHRRSRHVPRLRTLHPLKWESYLAETSSVQRVDILLSPLLATPFNAARAAVKCVDAARCGAAGLYSDRPPYRGFVRPDVDGLLLSDDQQQWLEAISDLVTKPHLRIALAHAGRERLLNLTKKECFWPSRPVVESCTFTS